MSKVTFFLVCKNGGRYDNAEEVVEVVETNIGYKDGLKLLRGLKTQAEKLGNMDDEYIKKLLEEGVIRP